MSKAEDLAKELYPDWKMTGVSTVDGLECSMVRIQRVAYTKGYHQAEKDLELTWDDISVLNCLLNEVEQEFRKGFHEDKSYIGYCKEVLKRFKGFKERKEK